MGKVYTICRENVAISTIVDLFEILPASDYPTELLRFQMALEDDTESLRVAIIRGHTTSGSAGSSFTPIQVVPGGLAFQGTAETLNTTIASAGTAVTPHADFCHGKGGLIYVPTPDEIIAVANAETLVVRVMAAPSASVNVSFSATIRQNQA